MTKKVISTRLEPLMIARARDGLMARGYDNDQLVTISNVVRLTFLHGMAGLMSSDQEIRTEPSKESLLWLEQKINQAGHKKTLTLQELIPGQNK